MPVHQSYPYSGRLLPRQPSMLRRVGEAIITWADRREVARAELARHDRVGHLHPDLDEVVDDERRAECSNCPGFRQLTHGASVQE